MRTILLAGACSMALSGCIPVAAGLALSAASLATGGSGGKGGEGFRNPVDRQTTGRQIRQALSQLDDQVDPACQAILDEHRQTHGTLAAGKAAQSNDPASGPASGAEGAAEGTAESKGTPAVPPVDLLAKVEPKLEPAKGDGAPADEVSPTKASLSPESTAAPGQCEHRFVCLPGTPKPTLMLMCPGKGANTPEDGKTMASAAPEAPAGEESAAPASEQTTAALDAATGTAATPAADSALSSDRTAPAAIDPAPGEKGAAPRTIQSGGVADWNWSFDPARQR